MNGKQAENSAGVGYSRASGSFLAEVLLGTVVSALGAVIFWQIAGLDVGPTYARIGPRIFPAIIATGLLLIGGGIILSAFLRPRLKSLPELHLTPILWVGGGLLSMILLIDLLGFVLAATALFISVARGFGTRRPILSLGIGLTLALACQFGFNYGLGVDLPWGLLSFLN